MRPVDKGNSPYGDIKDYSEAGYYLERAIGLYCSYCEYPIKHVPEVEHVVSKSAGGSLTEWGNLLFGCKYCNTRKGKKVIPESVEEYLWPDRYNTALAFNYDNGVPKVNKEALLKIDHTGNALSKAQNLFDLVGLDNRPGPREKDRRFRERNAAYEIALEAYVSWISIRKRIGAPSEELKQQIVENAKANGFFSVWMNVFASEPDMLNAFINAFNGTNRAYYNGDGSVRMQLQV